MPAPYEGGCACGAVRYRITAEPLISYLCHCTECRKRTSSAFGISAMVPTDALVVEKGTTKVRMRKGDSGNEIAGHFCADCGTSLFAAPVMRPQIRVLFAGTLDDPGWVPVELNIWADSALPWVHMDPAVERIGGQPNMADYIARKK